MILQFSGSGPEAGCTVRDAEVASSILASPTIIREDAPRYHLPPGTSAGVAPRWRPSHPRCHDAHLGMCAVRFGRPASGWVSWPSWVLAGTTGYVPGVFAFSGLSAAFPSLVVDPDAPRSEPFGSWPRGLDPIAHSRNSSRAAGASSSISWTPPGCAGSRDPLPSSLLGCHDWYPKGTAPRWSPRLPPSDA